MTEKNILYIAAACTLLMLLYPPVEICVGIKCRPAPEGFAFILDPGRYRSINLKQLVVQWLGLWAVCGFLVLTVRHQDK